MITVQIPDTQREISIDLRTSPRIRLLDRFIDPGDVVCRASTQPGASAAAPSMHGVAINFAQEVDVVIESIGWIVRHLPHSRLEVASGALQDSLISCRALDRRG